MHYLSSVYFVNQPLHVSDIFVAHHQEVYGLLARRPTDSQLKSITRTNCIYIPPLWSEFLATDTEVPGSIPGATRFSE